MNISINISKLKCYATVYSIHLISCKDSKYGLSDSLDDSIDYVQMKLEILNNLKKKGSIL